jgi:translation initiation factor 1
MDHAVNERCVVNKTSSPSTINGLGGLAGLAGLVVKEAPPISATDLAINGKALVRTKVEVQKTKDLVRVLRDAKGRGGKTVTVVTGISLVDKDLDALGKQLKASCGSGGTVKDGVIEVQGDHVDRIVMLLVAQGYKAKRAGG